MYSWRDELQNTIHLDIKKQYLQATKCYSAQTSPSNSSPFTECDIQSMLVQKADAESKGLLFLSAGFHCCPPSLEVQKRGYWSVTLNIQRRNRENSSIHQMKTQHPASEIWLAKKQKQKKPHRNMKHTLWKYGGNCTTILAEGSIPRMWRMTLILLAFGVYKKKKIIWKLDAVYKTILI